MTGSHLDPGRLQQQSSGSIGPWTPDQLAVVVAANTVGLGLILAGWWVGAGLGSAQHQLAWLNLCAVGLVVGGLANAWWLGLGHRVVSLAQAAVLPYPSTRGRWRGSAPAVAVPDELVVGAHMTRYHRPSCCLVSGKPVQGARRAEHERNGLVACEVCAP